MRCADCKFRSSSGHCENKHVREQYGKREVEDDSADLIYSYDEGGSFWVGPNFGCVHFDPKTNEAR